jgi:hypothetical protein
MRNYFIAVKRSLPHLWDRKEFAWLFLVIFCAILGWYTFHVPLPGKSVTFLGLAGTIMGLLWKRIGFTAKFLWLGVMVGFLFIEFKALEVDRQNSSRELGNYFKEISQTEQSNLSAILKNEHQQFVQLWQSQQDSINSQRRSFVQTMRALTEGEQRRNEEFQTLIAKQEQLFQAQQEVSEFLNGKLLPANDEMPNASCLTRAAPNDVIVSFGTHGSASIENVFPHTIVSVNDEPVLSINKTSSGLLVLSVNMRDALSLSWMKTDSS